MVPRRQAAMVVKNAMVGLHAGTKKLMNGWALDAQVPLAAYPLGVGGFKSTTFEKLWPAAYTYKLLIEKLDGLTECRRLALPDYVYVYECTVRGGRKVLVAFYDDHVARNHDEPLQGTTVTLPIRSARARVSHIVTEIDQTAPQVETLDASHGRLEIRLTEFPVFVEPLGPS